MEKTFKISESEVQRIVEKVGQYPFQDVYWIVAILTNLEEIEKYEPAETEKESVLLTEENS